MSSCRVAADSSELEPLNDAARIQTLHYLRLIGFQRGTIRHCRCGYRADLAGAAFRIRRCRSIKSESRGDVFFCGKSATATTMLRSI